jgi:uncharacterized protein (TIGR03032 family)
LSRRAESNRCTNATAPVRGRGTPARAAGPIAFVGLSKIREKDLFGGLPIAASFGEEQRKCGVAAVDLRSGQVIAFLWFEAGCTEIFDLQVLPGMRWPTVVGFQDETLDGIMVAPRAAWLPDPKLPVVE